MASQEEANAKSGNPLDSISVPSTVGTVDSPFQDYTSLTGFDAQAWIDSVKPFPACEPVKLVENAPTETIYELINSSSTTSELAKLVNEYPNVVSMLKSTEAKSVPRLLLIEIRLC